MKPPIPVIIVAVLFILIGCIGFAYHTKELFAPDYNMYETISVLLLRIVAIVCGILLLKKINWARWVTLAWIALHVIISTFNSIGETVVHIAFLIIVSVLLFLPASNLYFQKKKPL